MHEDWDVTHTIQAKSEQLCADDLIGGPITVQVTGVERGDDEQPVVVHIGETWHPWRPCKTSRRVLVAAWGPRTGAWVGRRVRLYRDATVTWAGREVGGIRIDALDGISEPLTVALAVSRGRKVTRTVRVLEAVELEREAGELERVMEQHQIDIESLDRWLQDHGRPPVRELTREQRDACARMLQERPDMARALSSRA